MANRVKVFVTTWCPYCVRAKSLLDRLSIGYDTIDLTDNDELRMQISQKTGMKTVPIIMIDDKCIGGSDDLHQLHETGELKKMLGA